MPHMVWCIQVSFFFVFLQNNLHTLRICEYRLVLSTVAHLAPRGVNHGAEAVVSVSASVSQFCE